VALGGLRRLVLRALALSVLLILAAAGAASAADRSDPAADPITTVTGPTVGLPITPTHHGTPVGRAARRAIDAATGAVRSARPVVEVARPVVARAGSVVDSFPPVPVISEILPSLGDRDERAPGPKQPQARATGDVQGRAPVIATPTSGDRALAARSTTVGRSDIELAGLPEPLLPAGSDGRMNSAALTGSSVAPSVWLAWLALGSVALALTAAVRPTLRFSIPRGLVLQPVVPPG
jgi:hypothetical protein